MAAGDCSQGEVIIWEQTFVFPTIVVAQDCSFVTPKKKEKKEKKRLFICFLSKNKRSSLIYEIGNIDLILLILFVFDLKSYCDHGRNSSALSSF